MTDSVLSAHMLTKTYGSTRALTGVGVEVRRGESLAIMGASGSGKTTLLHALAGIVRPDSGTVWFRPPSSEAIEVTTLSESKRSRLRRERLGFVFQEGLLIPELTAVENVALALMINGVKKQEATSHAARWLHALGLAGMEDRRIGELSGGQSQRVAIARAQATGAELIFADEPTGALDSQTSGEVMDALLWSTTGQGRTLIVVTHDPSVAARCSRTLSMRDGATVAEVQA